MVNDNKDAFIGPDLRIYSINSNNTLTPKLFAYQGMRPTNDTVNFQDLIEDSSDSIKKIKNDDGYLHVLTDSDVRITSALVHSTAPDKSICFVLAAWGAGGCGGTIKGFGTVGCPVGGGGGASINTGAIWADWNPSHGKGGYAGFAIYY